MNLFLNERLVMTSDDTGLALSSVQNYFRGERRELLAMLVGVVTLVSATAWLMFVAGDGFSRGLFFTVLVFGSIFGVGAASLLVRDVGLRQSLIASITNGQRLPSTATAMATERSRIEAVLSKFIAYRIAALIVAFIALGSTLASQGPWVNGFAVGLLLTAMSQAVIDHYSERRAMLYLQQLYVLTACKNRTMRAAEKA